MSVLRPEWLPLLLLAPLAWLGTVTMTAGYQKVFSADPKLGFLAHASLISNALAEGTLPAGMSTVEAARRVMFNDRLDAVIALIFMFVVVLVIAASLREWYLVLARRRPSVVHEAPFVPSGLAAGD